VYADATGRGAGNQQPPWQRPDQNVGDTVGSLQKDSSTYSGNAVVNWLDTTRSHHARDEGINKFPGGFTIPMNQGARDLTDWWAQLIPIPNAPPSAGETRPVNAAVNWIIRVR
jgi:hypothetical protein